VPIRRRDLVCSHRGRRHTRGRGASIAARRPSGQGRLSEPVRVDLARRHVRRPRRSAPLRGGRKPRFDRGRPRRDLCPNFVCVGRVPFTGRSTVGARMDMAMSVASSRLLRKRAAGRSLRRVGGRRIAAPGGCSGAARSECRYGQTVCKAVTRRSTHSPGSGCGARIANGHCPGPHGTS
jgi:hypothetical protein